MLPRFHARLDDAPTNRIVGTAVTLVLPAMDAALRQAGKTVVLTRIDSDDWKLRTASTRTALLKAAVPFIEQYNPSDTH